MILYNSDLQKITGMLLSRYFVIIFYRDTQNKNFYICRCNGRTEMRFVWV
jgi:hypothetical protein